MTKNAVRKTISIIMVASLLIAIVAQALYPIQVAALTSPGNLLYDPFDGDTTLGNIGGTVSFAPSGNNTQGFDMGGSVGFNGTGSWGGYILYGVELKPSPFVTNPGTLELWVRKDNWVLPEGRREDILTTSTWSNLGIHLLLYGAELQLSGQSTVFYDTSDLDTGWHHFAIAWDEKVTSLYIDGEYIGKGGGITSEHNTLGLSAGDELKGYIDEFASYDYMKTGDQIRQDFKAKSSPHENVAPTVEAGDNQTVNQGDTVSFSGSFTDPDSDTHTILWDFGDGVTADGNLEVDHLYAAGNYTVTLTVTDDDGGEGIDTLQVTVIDTTHQAPTADANGSYTGAEGSPITFDGGSSSDPDGTIDAYDWDLDGDGLFDDATGAITSDTWGDDYAGNIGLKVTDNDGLSDTDTTAVTVSNVAPTVVAGADQTVNQGDIVSLIGSFTDPGWLDTHTIHWEFGDGNTAEGGLEVIEVDHLYAAGNYTVTLTVTDDDGGIGSDTLQVTVVTVSNVAPTVVAGDNQTVNQGVTVSFNGSFTDPDTADTHTAKWDWGDDGTSPGIVNQADGSVNGSHTYTTTGVYTVKLTVTDDDGGIGSDTLQVTVIDMPDGTRAMLEFQIERVKIEVSKGKVSVKGTFELDPSGDDADISEEVVVIMGPLSETIPGGTMVVDKNGNWEYKRPTDDEGIIKKMKIDWKKGKFEFSMDNAYLSKLTDPDNVTISIQIGDDFGQTTIMMEITYGYSMPR